MSCLIPDIHNPMSSVPDTRVRMSMWIANAWSRSCASIAAVKTRVNIGQKELDRQRLTAYENEKLLAQRL